MLFDTTQRRPAPARQRHCCDGGCTEGLPCPTFAPGVIDGPAWRQHPCLRWWAAQSRIGNVVATVLVLVLGTWAWRWMEGFK